ncbi:MAG: hypothetical protein JST23_06355 [Bacteroidetes bacterium]|nr:hypothetical protein [Bacteroidota bacterium]
MKKLIIVSIAAFVSSSLFSQSAVPTNAKTMSIAEAKALQGNAEPTINGMPYSQYKAQQDALKNTNKTTAPIARPGVGIGPNVASVSKQTEPTQKAAGVNPNSSSEIRKQEDQQNAERQAALLKEAEAKAALEVAKPVAEAINLNATSVRPGVENKIAAPQQTEPKIKTEGTSLDMNVKPASTQPVDAAKAITPATAENKVEAAKPISSMLPPVGNKDEKPVEAKKSN